MMNEINYSLLGLTELGWGLLGGLGVIIMFALLFLGASSGKHRDIG